MATLAAFDLRKVGVANGLARLASHPLHQLLLRKRTIQPAQRTLDFAEVANFFAKRHIPNRHNNIAI